MIQPNRQTVGKPRRCDGAFKALLRRVAFSAALVLAAKTAFAQSAPTGLKVQPSSVTGLATFVTASDGAAIPLPAVPGKARPQPRDFLLRHGALFGISDVDRQLSFNKKEVCLLNRTCTTYDQVHDGVRVFSGVIKVHQTAAGDVVAANGDFYPISPKLSTTPGLSAREAEGIVTRLLAPHHPVIEHTELVIVDPGWYGDPPRGAHLAYYVVASDWAVPVSEASFVEAHTGEVLDRWSLIHTAKDRAIYDGEGGVFLPGVLKRFEGEDPVLVPEDVNRAYDYYGDVYDYYHRAFGRDSIDDKGLTMKATVNSTLPGCPNAFWSPGLLQMVFCSDTVTDDIVGHELTHGVTQFTANLIYQNQPGQLNESFSDIFGELVDLFNGNAAFAGTPGFPGSPNETAWPIEALYTSGPGTDVPNNARTGPSPVPDYDDGVRWLLGEDAAAFGGAIRDMWDPEGYGSPADANSPLQTCHPLDSGGVHFGSGIPNHAFAIMTDGKTFNGITVSGIGPIKAGAVWYRALSVYLTVASDFKDAFVAVNQAAQDLVGVDLSDPRTGLPSGDPFTVQDADQVNKAMLAVEMHTDGACGAVADIFQADDPPQCSLRGIIFEDDFEAGTSGWTVENVPVSMPYTPYDWQLTSTPLPLDRAGIGWFVADLDSDCTIPPADDEAARHSLISPVISLPALMDFPTAAFAQYVRTEADFDGGNLKIRTDGGAWTLVAAGDIQFNSYNSTIRTVGGNHNSSPLAGETAWTGLSGKWGTTVIDLSNYFSGGESTVQFRFDFGKDYCAGLTGWYIDDFSFYQCIQSVDCNSNGVPDEVETAVGIAENIVVSFPSTRGWGFSSDADDNDGFPLYSWAQKFSLNETTTITGLRIWGAYLRNDAALANDFTVIFHGDARGLPGTAVATYTRVPFTRVHTERLFFDYQEWELTLKLADPTLNQPAPVTLGPGNYHIEIFNNTVGNQDNFYWISSEYVGSSRISLAFEAPGQTWLPGSDFDLYYNLSLELIAGLVSGDCNGNAIVDDCDISHGTSSDCNNNNVPDECEAPGDCNRNGVPDICDVGSGVSEDCNLNTIPDACESSDCNGNQIRDVCDIATGVSDDCDLSGVPDECEDGPTAPNHNCCETGHGPGCNDQDIMDCVCALDFFCCAEDWDELCVDLVIVLGCGSCDVTSGAAPADCNNNDRPDRCDIGAGFSTDCNTNGKPDECEHDSDGDGVLNDCEQCPFDDTKTEPGACGCGSPDIDSDADGVLDCNDGCPSDGNKTSPGPCGCGQVETDADNDSVPDCLDQCEGADDTIDTDSDGSPDCADKCPNDPEEISPGTCGCGVPEDDTDQDGVLDCVDNCPTSSNDTQLDADSDGVGDACDGCPNDASKTAIGVCGCGIADSDADGDGTVDCVDNCPALANADQDDADSDGAGDECDGCPNDADKIDVGTCGCGVPDVDSDLDGVFNCNDDCPGTAPGAEVDERGCLVVLPAAVQPVPDGDGDGVADNDDLCPGTPEGDNVDTNGCSTAGSTPTPTPTPTPAPEAQDAGCADGVACGSTGTGAMLMLMMGLTRMKTGRHRRRRE